MPEIIPDLVSTIIPAFNRPKMLQEAVASVLNQDYRPIQVIIVNDGSTDNTGATADELSSRHPEIISVIHKENSGAGPSREAGRRIALGEFIQYLDSDDLLAPGKFSKQVQALRNQPECGAAYGWIMLEDESGARGNMPYKKSGEKRDTLFPWILSDRWWNTNCPLWRRTLVDQIGPWSSLRWSQDWEYDARAGSLGTKLAYVPHFVTIQRQHIGVRQTSAADWLKPERIRNRTEFFELMIKHADAACITHLDQHRQHFARWAFAIARRAASIGMIEDAKRLIDVAYAAAGDCADAKRGIATFRFLSTVLGWKITGTISEKVSRLRNPSDLTLEHCCN